MAKARTGTGECITPGCDKTNLIALYLCASCYCKRWRKGLTGHHLDKAKVKKIKAICMTDNCTDEVYAKGICIRCYGQMHRKGFITPTTRHVKKMGGVVSDLRYLERALKITMQLYDNTYGIPSRIRRHKEIIEIQEKIERLNVKQTRTEGARPSFVAD